jgi:hypothetical protein
MSQAFLCILDEDGRTPVPITSEDYERWSQWMSTHDRKVRQSAVGRGFVSTVFLGQFLPPTRYPWRPDGYVCFETLLTLPDGDSAYLRDVSWDEALATHAKCVGMLVDLQDMEKPPPRVGGGGGIGEPFACDSSGCTRQTVLQGGRLMAETERVDRRRSNYAPSKSITVSMEQDLLAQLDDWVAAHGGARSGWLAIMVRYCLIRVSAEELLGVPHQAPDS